MELWEGAKQEKIGSRAKTTKKAGKKWTARLEFGGTWYTLEYILYIGKSKFEGLRGDVTLCGNSMLRFLEMIVKRRF